MDDVWEQLVTEFGDPLEFGSTADIKTAVEIIMGKEAAIAAKEEMDSPSPSTTGAEPPDPAVEIELQAKAWSGVISAAITRIISMHQDLYHS